MKLNERIKACRQRSGLTQEQVAEALDVSRQAVTKWENGQSAPSTDNLFRLAELFGTTVDLILTTNREKNIASADEVSRENNRSDRVYRLHRRYKILKMVLFTVLYYPFVALIGYCLRWLGVPMHYYMDLLGTHLYRSTPLFEMLRGGNIFSFGSIISIILSLFGLTKLSFSFAVSFLAGMVAGELLGPYIGKFPWDIDADVSIFLGFLAVGLVIGIILECFAGKRHRNDGKNIEKST